MSHHRKNPLYFICLMPPSNIRGEIEKFKKEIKAKFGIKHALKLPAHITLQIPFRMPKSKEKILIRKLGKFCLEHKSFKTELDGFGKFAKHVIYINIKNHIPYIQLHQNLQDLMLDFLELQSHEISTKIHPHITIATRDLKRSDFPLVWNDFKNRDYSSSFRAENISILKHNGKTWDIIKSLILAVGN